MDRLMSIHRIQDVKRWHTYPVTRGQNLAEHSWSVAILAAYLADWTPSAELLMAALVHDVAETELGDIPSTAKWEFGNVQISPTEEIERRLGVFETIHALPEGSTRTLWWADKLDMLVHSVTEIRLGNAPMEVVFDRVWMKLETQKDIPPRAMALMNYLAERVDYPRSIPS